jgi:hypothetical protein
MLTPIQKDIVTLFEAIRNLYMGDDHCVDFDKLIAIAEKHGMNVDEEGFIEREEDNVKKLRIISASDPEYWYADKIGEIFEIDSEDKEKGGYMVYDGWVNGGLVEYEDAELLDEREVSK